jgi:DNA-binding LacI/PurR family transcriptional regulator
VTRLKDIARRAGVSIMTVSKVMRDAPDISGATKARVRLLAQQMGYVPNTLARSLRTRTTRLLGLVLPALTEPVVARTAMAIEERAAEAGFDLLVAQTLNLPEREDACLRRLLGRRVDGLFIAPISRLADSLPVYQELAQRGLPTVILGHPPAFCQSFVNVAGDDQHASLCLTEHLLHLGHRRIAFLSGPQTSPTAQERFAGYRLALREANLTVDDRLVFTAGSTIEEGARAAAQLLAESPHATAVQAFNDRVAIGAASLFLDRGLKIPEDMSVVGFGNVLLSQYFRVPLTTVRQPKFRLGAAAVESMLKLLHGQRPDSTRLSVELVVRQSTAPPKLPNAPTE